MKGAFDQLTGSGIPPGPEAPATRPAFGDDMVRIQSVLCASAALLLGVSCGGSSSSSPSNNFSAAMNNANEKPAPPVASTATGTATFSVSDTTVTYTVNFTGLTGNPTVSHIHVGDPTASPGAVVVPFKVTLPAATSGTFTGTFTEADIVTTASPLITNLNDLLTQMRAGNTYANVHTAANPGGEIRGQIQPQ
jgi:CHRD domain